MFRSVQKRADLELPPAILLSALEDSFCSSRLPRLTLGCGSGCEGERRGGPWRWLRWRAPTLDASERARSNSDACAPNHCCVNGIARALFSSSAETHSPRLSRHTRMSAQALHGLPWARCNAAK